MNPSRSTLTSPPIRRFQPRCRATSPANPRSLDGCSIPPSEVVGPRRHHTDGCGDSDMSSPSAPCSVSFGAADPDLQSRPSLQLRQGGRPSVARTTHRRAHQHALHSAPTGLKSCGSRLDPYWHRAASLIVRQLASYPRQNGLAAALARLVRLELTLFTATGWRMRNCSVRTSGIGPRRASPTHDRQAMFSMKTADEGHQATPLPSITFDELVPAKCGCGERNRSEDSESVR